MGTKQINKITLKPFVKWAGGKTQLLSQLNSYVPKKYGRYLEPFVGGGAFLFSLSPKSAIINDSNGELINCYKVLRNSPKLLIEELKKHTNDEDYYYSVRKLKPENLSKIERAARVIFLNKTCFNGLWRVNKKNEFNTPFGHYKNPKLVHPELFNVISKFLKNVDIYEMDFSDFLLKFAKRGDFIYLDPPYHPISKYSDFKRYTKDFFGIDEQRKLANLFIKLNKKGCNLLLSNSHSDLILDLYSDFNINIVEAKRLINKNALGRGAVKEVLINNYENSY